MNNNLLENDCYNPLRAMELELDWKELISKLPELNRNICQRLLAGQTITFIAKELEISRRQVKHLACDSLQVIAIDYDIKMTEAKHSNDGSPSVISSCTQAPGQRPVCPQGGASPGSRGRQGGRGSGESNGSPLAVLSIRLTAKKSKC